MSDLGGSHSWLIDVGGGTERAAVRSAADGDTRPRDDDVARFVARAAAVHRGTRQPAPAIERAVLGDRVERVTWPGGSAILKLGGFRRADVEPRLYPRLDPDRDGAPRLLAVEQERGWLLLEDLRPAAPVDPADAAQAPAVYRRLAEIHAHHAGATYAELSGAPLTARDADAFAAGAAALSRLVERAAGDRQAWEIGAEHRAACRRVVAWAQEAGPRLIASGPTTLLHGDYQRRNWLIAGGQVRVVDWELAALGPGVLDLYYLAPDGPDAGHAPAGPMAHAAIVAYCARLADLGARGPGADRVAALLSDAIVWGAVAGAVLRLGDFYAETPRGRTPRSELPGAAASLIGSVLRRVR